MNCIYVKNLGEIYDKIDTLAETTLVYEEDTGKVYMVKDKDFFLCSAPESNIQLSSYDLNKQLMNQFKPIDDEALKQGIAEIDKFITETNNTYYMLLCKELSYYTVFVKTVKPQECIEDVVVECANNVGVIKSIEYDGVGAIEIWVSKDDDSYAMYFFPYDGGVVEC